jgi:hypothetical protein
MKPAEALRAEAVEWDFMEAAAEAEAARLRAAAEAAEAEAEAEALRAEARKHDQRALRAARFAIDLRNEAAEAEKKAGRHE